MSIIEIVAPDSEELTVDQSHAAMDVIIRDRLGITRVEFLELLDSGAYNGTDDADLLHLITLEPFAR